MQNVYSQNTTISNATVSVIVNNGGFKKNETCSDFKTSLGIILKIKIIMKKTILKIEKLINYFEFLLKKYLLIKPLSPEMKCVLLFENHISLFNFVSVNMVKMILTCQ